MILKQSEFNSTNLFMCYRYIIEMMTIYFTMNRGGCLNFRSRFSVRYSVFYICCSVFDVIWWKILTWNFLHKHFVFKRLILSFKFVSKLFMFVKKRNI